MKKILLTAAAASAILAAEAVTLAPKATDGALINPDMGFVYYHYSNRLWAYGINTKSGDTLDWFPGCSTVYFRVLWNDLEPEEGQFRWDIFDSVAQNWIRKGKKIAIRVIACNQTETATPEFVRQAGAKGFWFEYRTDTVASGKLPPRWEPKYDDPVFLAKLENFLKAFARRYDGDPSVAFVDIGTFGIYGECHVWNTSQQYLQQDPKNKDEFERLAKIHLDLWKRHLPNTYLVVSDDLGGGWTDAPDHPMMQYCREKGIGFRDDSIFCMGPEPAANHPDGSWAHSHWARSFAPHSPVVIEHGHVLMCEHSGRWVTERMLECVEKTQASYWSIHLFPDEYLKRYRKEIEAINRRLGYRFELRRAEWPDVVTVGEPVTVRSDWVNVGVSWCHRGAFLTWSLRDGRGDVVWSVTDESFDFRKADPKLNGVEKAVSRATACRFGFTQKNPDPDVVLDAARDAGMDPGEFYRMLPAGEYDLCVSRGSRDGRPEIALPLRGGKDRVYPLGKIRVVEKARH